MNEYRTVKTKCESNGRPAWFGQYRPVGTENWRTVRSMYGKVLYTTEGYALTGAHLFAKECDAEDLR